MLHIATRWADSVLLSGSGASSAQIKTAYTIIGAQLSVVITAFKWVILLGMCIICVFIVSKKFGAKYGLARIYKTIFICNASAALVLLPLFFLPLSMRLYFMGSYSFLLSYCIPIGLIVPLI